MANHLRAKITEFCRIHECGGDRQEDSKKTRPDLTHLIEVKAGDTCRSCVIALS